MASIPVIRPRSTTAPVVKPMTGSVTVVEGSAPASVVVTPLQVGRQGPQGVQGPPGADSTVAGPQGVQGPQGPQGVQGPVGAPGTSTIIIGSVATVAALPPANSVNVGDGYIVDADGDLYTSNGTVWHDLGQIQGPQGVQGVQGSQGVQGPPGPSTGPAGGDLSGTYPNPTVAQSSVNFTAPNISTPGNVVSGGIVRAGGGVIDLWTDGRIYLAGQTVSIYGSSNALRTPNDLVVGGLVTATLGTATRTKAGTPVDADWAVAPPNGTIVIDTTASKLWARVGGVWKGAVLT